MEDKSNLCCEIRPSKKKKSRVLPVTLVSLAILFIAGITGAYFYLGQPDLVSDVPPSLDMVGSKFQGQSIGDRLGTLVFDQTDVDTYEMPLDANFKTSFKGVQYFYSEQDLFADEIIKNVKPESGLQLLIAFYSPGEEFLGTEECYYIYPKGPYLETCEISDTSTFTIPKGRGFALIASMDFEYNSKVINNSQTVPSSEYLDSYIKNEGWVLLPVEKLETLKTEHSNNTWVQASDNAFEKVDKDNPAFKDNYSMVWFKVQEVVEDVYQTR